MFRPATELVQSLSSRKPFIRLVSRAFKVHISSCSRHQALKPAYQQPLGYYLANHEYPPLGLFTFLATRRPLTAYIGLNGWLPSAAQIASAANREKLDDFLGGILNVHSHEIPFLFEAIGTDVFLAHTTDDEVVDVELGRQARDVLRGVGYRRVVWWEEGEGGHPGMLNTKGLDWVKGCLREVVGGEGEEMDWM